MKRGAFGFTLIEVVVALGVMAIGVAGILALLGPATDASRELDDASVAARVIERVRVELEAARDTRRAETSGALLRLRDELGEGWRIVADQRGERLLAETAADEPGGLVERARYFLVEVRPHEGALSFPADAAFLACLVQVRWPHRLPVGVDGPAIAVAPAQAQTLSATVVLSP